MGAAMDSAELSRVTARAISALGLDWHVVNVFCRGDRNLVFEFEDGPRIRTVYIRRLPRQHEENPDHLDRVEAELKARLREVSMRAARP
jgi:hypothetical protein